MSKAFQPAACDPADIASLRALLLDTPEPDDLEQALAAQLAMALSRMVRSEMTQAGSAFSDPATVPLDAAALSLHLVRLMVQVQDNGDQRAIRIGDCRLQVRLNTQGQAIGYWQTGDWQPERQLQEPLNNAEWIVALGPLLRGWTGQWLLLQPWFEDLWPVERHELPRTLATVVRRTLEGEGPLLKALLLRRIGYPSGFLQCYLRELGRGTPHPTPAEIGCLLAEWETLRRWPRRARKLVWLALPLREAGLIGSLRIDDVRAALRAQGLPRNAWARLHQVPLPQLRDLGLTLGHWQAEGRLADFLPALGFLLSRLGPCTRFYRAWRHQLPEIVSDIPSRLTALRTGLRAPVCGERQQWYRLQRRSASLRVLNGVVPGAELPPEQVKKTDLLLTAIARHLLHSATPEAMARHREDLSDLIDWFRACSPLLPPQAFKGEVPALLRQSRQWHERMCAERERGEQAARLQQLQQEQQRQQAQGLQAQPPGPRPTKAKRTVAHRWRVPLREHAWQDFRFLTLEHEAELMEEAMEMRHCVDSYASECQAGECHIVSIRWGKLRIATMELRRGWSKRWEQEQLKGRFNAIIASDFEMMGQLLRLGIADFSRAFNADPPKMENEVRPYPGRHTE
ncbi:MAG: PcfJ-like protein [Moraxellaceae bacterium]|jgi:hypothetical protein|nr:PcfJ-like protein [Moraxellaceae bacterium]